MIDIKGTKNFTIVRGDTFEFAFKSNFMNLIDSVTLVCKKLDIRKDFDIYNTCYYFRLDAEETLELPEEVKSVNYMVLLNMKSGVVKTLFYDGVFDIVDGANDEESESEIGEFDEEYEDVLEESEACKIQPSFTVNLYDWVRVQIPTMIHVEELPAPSLDTSFNFYYRESDETIWLVKTRFNPSTGKEYYVWDQLVTAGEMALARLQEDLLVTREVGGLSIGDFYPKGTTIETVLRDMLRPQIIDKCYTYTSENILLEIPASAVAHDIPFDISVNGLTLLHETHGIQYEYFAYPANLGRLSSIIQNDFINALDAWKLLGTVNKGGTVYYIYITIDTQADDTSAYKFTTGGYNNGLY